MFEKIKLTDDEGNELEVSVIEQTKINNTSYLLVTDSEDDEEEINAFIVKDLSSPEDEDAIYGFVEDDNIRSKRLCERLGMRREGCFKEFVTFVNNPDGSPKYEDTCVYAILEKEWNTIRQW